MFGRFCVSRTEIGNFVSMLNRVDLHRPKTVIIQIHTSNVWKSASHTIFVQFQKIIEKRFELVLRLEKKTVIIQFPYKKIV